MSICPRCNWLVELTGHRPDIGMLYTYTDRGVSVLIEEYHSD